MAKKIKDEPALKKAENFITTHTQKMRTILDTIARYDIADIDRKTMEALSDSFPMEMRAKAAFAVVAWNVVIRPYEHPERQYSVNLDPFKKIIERNADALYMYATVVLREPSKDIEKKLKALHPQVAKDYSKYCREYRETLQVYETLPLALSW